MSAPKTGVTAPKLIEENKIKALMRLKPTLEDTAAFFECHPRTIERYIRDTFDLTFAEFRDQNMVHTRFGLVRKAISKAESGDNVMLIFCLKNLCGWRDKQPDETEVVVNNVNTMSETEIDSKINKLMESK